MENTEMREYKIDNVKYKVINTFQGKSSIQDILLKLAAEHIKSTDPQQKSFTRSAGCDILMDE